MSIFHKSKNELELMPLNEIAYYIVKEKGQTFSTKDLFMQVCNLLGLSDDEFESQIGDFFTMLTTDKNFILIENGNWDLKENHNISIVIDEDSDEIIEEVDGSIDEEIEDEEEKIVDEEIIDDDIDDDMEDLSIVDEELELED